MARTTEARFEDPATGEIAGFRRAAGLVEELVPAAFAASPPTHTISIDRQSSSPWPEACFDWRCRGFLLSGDRLDVPAATRVLSFAGVTSEKEVTKVLAARDRADVLALDVGSRRFWPRILSSTDHPVEIRYRHRRDLAWSADLADRVLGLGPAEPSSDDHAASPAEWLDREIKDEDLALIARAPRLRALDLARSDVTDRGLRALAGATALERLSLPFGARGRGLEHLAHLSALHTVARPIIDDDGDATAADLRAYGRLEGLRELVLAIQAPKRRALDELAGLARLEALTLVSGGEVPAAAFLAGMSHLRRLRLAAPGRVQGLDDALRGMPGIEVAHLHVAVGDAVAEAAGAAPRLRVLDVAGSKEAGARLTDRGIAALTGPALRSLRARGDLTDQSLRALGQRAGLVALSLGGRFGEDGILALSGLANLHYLELTSVSEGVARGLATLHAAGLPRTRLRLGRIAPGARPILAKAFGDSLAEDDLLPWSGQPGFRFLEDGVPVATTRGSWEWHAYR